MLKVVAALTAGLVAMGGWAVVTVKDLPEYFVAGQQYTIEFQVRQHGRMLMNNVQPQLLVATSGPRLAGLAGGANETALAANRTGDGTYRVSFTVPQSERVYLTIMSGWGVSNLRLYPVRVVSASARPASLAAGERGQALFVAKGCNACHSNIDLADRPDNQSLKVGPELGGRHLARDYVIQKIKNPNSQNMPDLGLSDAEAAAIAAFLSGGAATTGGR